MSILGIRGYFCAIDVFLCLSLNTCWSKRITRRMRKVLYLRYYKTVMNVIINQCIFSTLKICYNHDKSVRVDCALALSLPFNQLLEESIVWSHIAL